MNNIRQIKKLSRLGARFVSGVKRKYPLDPAHADELPVFQYGPSKKDYKRVFSWGNVQTGALGLMGLIDKDRPMLHSPKRLGFAEKFLVETAAAGFGFTALSVNSKTDVKLYGTGLNTDSQIGYHAIRTGHPLGILYYLQPISLPFRDPENSKILKLAAGRAHLLVLTSEGLFLLGNNAYGQCGRKIVPNEDYSRSNLVHHLSTMYGKRIVDVACGQDHSTVLAEDGSVYSCGWGADGQTGLGHYNNTEEFTLVKGDIYQERITKLACRSDFVLALNDKGETFGWGNTEYSQIPLPSGDQQLSIPTSIDMVNKLGPIKSIASSGSFCLAVTENGAVYSWGYGLLGLGPDPQLSKKPLQIPPTLFGQNSFQPNNIVVKVTCGLSYAAAITTLVINAAGIISGYNYKPLLEFADDQQFRNFTTGSLHDVAPNSIYLGWGARNTQFKGSMRQEESKRAIPLPPSAPIVSWRGNGELFVVNYWKDSRRFLKVFDCNIVPLFESEPFNTLFAATTFKAQGNFIACAATDGTHNKIVVFEKNCQVKSSFFVVESRGLIIDVQYHGTQHVLAVHSQHFMNNFVNIYLYSNDVWYLKQQLLFPLRDEEDFLRFQWINEMHSTSFKFSILTSQTVYVYEYILDTFGLHNDLIGVINGPTVLFTDFSKIMPPPMSSHSITFERPVNTLVFY
ncbi:hypothetical protein YQE_09274, partial [Dendroctonus ponderosae]